VCVRESPVMTLYSFAYDINKIEAHTNIS